MVSLMLTALRATALTGLSSSVFLFAAPLCGAQQGQLDRRAIHIRIEPQRQPLLVGESALGLSSLLTSQLNMPRVYVDANETVDAGNSKDKAKQIDFGSAIAAALVKKRVPVVVVTDSEKAQWTIKTVSSQKEDSTGTKIAKLAFGVGAGFTKFEGTIQVIERESGAVIYAYNVKKGNFQSAAEAFAKHFKGDYLEKR